MDNTKNQKTNEYITGPSRKIQHIGKHKKRKTLNKKRPYRRKDNGLKTHLKKKITKKKDIQIKEDTKNEENTQKEFVEASRENKISTFLQRNERTKETDH